MKRERGYYCVGSRITGEVDIVPVTADTPKWRRKQARDTREQAICAYLEELDILKGSAVRLLQHERAMGGVRNCTTCQYGLKYGDETKPDEYCHLAMPVRDVLGSVTMMRCKQGDVCMLEMIRHIHEGCPSFEPRGAKP